MSDIPRLTRHRPALPALTGIRLFAACYVVVLHTRIAPTLREHGFMIAARFISNGFLAVPLFFLLSGWILAYTYRGQVETSRERRHFWEARFARIWPAYAFSLLLSTLLAHSTPTAGLSVATLLMVQAWNPLHPEYAGAWNMVCWSLSVEAFFYLCFPWCQRRLERLSPRALRNCVVMLVIGAIAAHTAIRTLDDQTYAGIFSYIPLPLIHLPEFLAGAAAGNLFLQTDTHRSAMHSRASQSGMLTWLGFAASLVSLSLMHGAWSGTCVLGFSLLLYGLASERTWLSKLLSTRLLLIGGCISYSIYLLQTPVRYFVKAAFTPMHAGDGVIGMLIVDMLLLLLSLATFYWIEEPARRFLRARFASMDRSAV